MTTQPSNLTIIPSVKIDLTILISREGWYFEKLFVEVSEEFDDSFELFFSHLVFGHADADAHDVDVNGCLSQNAEKDRGVEQRLEGLDFVNAVNGGGVCKGKGCNHEENT